MRGLVHIYCGDGKGKTTAAVGLAVRCAGGGGKVLFVSFLKDNKSGERNILGQLENVTLLKNPDSLDFYKTMTDAQKEEYRQFCEKTMEITEQTFDSYDMIVMDEIMAALSHNLIDSDRIIKLIENRSRQEIVLTGRNPSSELKALADYITEMKKIKHPFDSGIKARKLIEM